MNSDNLPEKQAGEPPPNFYNLGAMLKAHPRLYHITQLRTSHHSFLGLRLNAMVLFSFGQLQQQVKIHCVAVVDYAIRPPNPALLMGGPPLEYFEDHERLKAVTQYVPNCDDGEMFRPPIKFTLLKIDQSYVVAKEFLLCIEDKNHFKNASGMDERRKQIATKAWIEGLTWMDGFKTQPPQMRGFY